MLNFDEMLISSAAHLHPACFVANGFDDDGTKSYTPSLVFLSCFSIATPENLPLNNFTCRQGSVF